MACTGDDPVLTSPTDSGTGPTADADDAGADVVNRACDLAKDFGPPVPLSGLATTEHAESFARLSPDERVVYFVRAGYVDASTADFRADIYTASRATTTQPFEAFRSMTELGGEGADTAPTVTGDRKDVFFERSSVTGVRIWMATGKSPPFPTATELAGPINEGLITGAPYVTPDGEAIYCTKRPTGGGTSRRIYRAARGTGGYTDVQPLADLGTIEVLDDDAPVVTPDELTLYWSTKRGGATQDIFVATRADKNAPFKGVRRVDSVSTTAREEIPTFVSADGCRLYYSSSIRATPPEIVSDILVATKPK